MNTAYVETLQVQFALCKLLETNLGIDLKASKAVIGCFFNLKL